MIFKRSMVQPRFHVAGASLSAIPPIIARLVKINLGNSNILSKDHKTNLLSPVSSFYSKRFTKVGFLNFASRLVSCSSYRFIRILLLLIFYYYYYYYYYYYCHYYCCCFSHYLCHYYINVLFELARQQLL